MFGVMEVTLSDIYRFQKPELIRQCINWNLSAEGTVQELRERLTGYVRSYVVADMETKAESVDKGSAEVDLVSTDMSLGFRVSSEAPMLSDLLKDVPRLMSEEPGETLRFFVDIKAIYDLNLVPDKVFWLKVLPKT